ncbi:MAG TPA: D-tyrosyl-tRNA(Tyr) deacylase [Deltaproteobacteria bacterium]|nr:D-tyrosyl-tRNA(Tyr) deacylase [Deltaproteobacteria bacterium]
MRAVIQRVRSASVQVEGVQVGAIEQGLLVLLGIGPGDSAAEVRWMAHKIAGLRIFEDDSGRMNRSVLELGAAVLVVSQFTLYGDCRKGRRPSFVGAAPPEVAEPLYLAVCDALAASGLQVEQGRFGAHMVVQLLNDGPVTLILETP